jgi:ubiquinone/menaquinone biosynthesis C-methylase UbiE
VTEIWSERAEAYRVSEHREGADLDRLVEWCEPGPAVQALDVASGGGHVARRLREAGCAVTTLDPAPGMRADVLARAEDIQDWRALLAGAGLAVEAAETFEKRRPVEA